MRWLGGNRPQLTIPATDDGTLEALRFAGELDAERVWALEDCRHVSGRLERGLLAGGDRVVRVAPGLTETSRRAVREPGKSDPIDATAIARAALREGIDTLPVAFLDEQAHEIRDPDRLPRPARPRARPAYQPAALASRADRPAARSADPALRAGRPTHPGETRPPARAAAPQPQLRVAKTTLKRICEICREEQALLAELKTLIEAHCPQLLDERGCGPVTAAIIIGHTAGAKRFPTDACFARHAGTAPIPASSGNTQRHRLHRGGDRQLNRAIHIIALSRARTDPATRAYLDRRHAEGKTKREAIRCLKRHLARRIWRLLYTTTPARNPTTETLGHRRRSPHNGLHGLDLIPNQPARLAGCRIERDERVRALVCVHPDHDHVHRPFVGCGRRERIPGGHTSVGGDATLLSSHAGDPRRRRATRQKPVQANGRQANRESARRRPRAKPTSRTTPTAGPSGSH